jgi:spore coat polysaccharide biosynthesis predicted glycosyltransferase SpsG
MPHRLSQGGIAMGYGHAERNLALIRRLDAETRELLGTLDQLDPEQSVWLREVTSSERRAVHQCRPETAAAPQAI